MLDRPGGRRLLALLQVLHRRTVSKEHEAREYVGTTLSSGRIQFEILRREGLESTSQVLEVGCGALHASLFLIEFLDAGHFVGLDPNEWLRETRLRRRRVRRLVQEKRARFLTREDFDASAAGVLFDYVLAHSVLSHAAHWQLRQFMTNVAKVLAPAGRIVASIRLAEGNDYGSTGTPNKDDSRNTEWVYPGVSWFKLSTVRATADEVGLDVRVVPEYTALLTSKRPGEYHDWLVLTRKASSAS